MFYTWSVMQNNAQYAAMMMATGQVTSWSGSGVSCGSSLASTQVEYYACAGLPPWTTFTAKAAETCSGAKCVGFPYDQRVDRRSGRHLFALLGRNTDCRRNRDEARKLSMTVLQNAAKVAPEALRRAKASWQALGRSKKGSIAVMAAVSIPSLIMFGGLSVDQSYVNVRVSMLRHAAQDAALAGGMYLSTYYTTGSSTTIVNAAQSTAKLNLPIAKYGTVVPSANVVLGTWNSSSKTFTATTTNPTAVKVTALNTVANSNPVNTFFGGAYGVPTVDHFVIRGCWLPEPARHSTPSF